MKHSFSISLLVVACLWNAVLPVSAQVNVTQQHNNPSRDGLYIDSAFTPANAANLTRDLTFNGTVSGNVYAQPLYVEGGPNGAMVIAVTESNNVYALDANDGSVIWQRNLGPAVTSGLPCGNISPLGISGTPVVDLSSRSLFLDAMIDGATKKHFVYSLNVDTGVTNPNWPADLNASVPGFTSNVQNERGGLAIVNGILYVPFSGLAGDCGTYRGWVVGIPINNPSSVMAWATDAIGGGIWGHSGVASDGTNMFVITGNTFNASTWMGGEAIIRLQAGPIFSGQPTDYWAPTNWQQLDNGDTDLGGVSATLVDVPGATPSHLVLALGKDAKAYLINRNNLGGIAAPVASANLPTAVRGQSAATYHTGQGTYFVFHTESNAVAAYKVNPTSPPTISSAWTVSQTGLGSTFVTSTDSTNNVIVWVAGGGGDGRLYGYNGDTGAVIYGGGGANELMTGTRKWNTGIVARGRIYYPADNKIYSFNLPIETPTPTPTPSVTPTPTPPVTPTPSPTATPTSTPSVTPTPTATPTATATPTPPPPTPTATTTPMPSAVTADFNGDGHPDWVVRNVNTGLTALVYLNDNAVVGAALGPSLMNNLALIGAADFNLDTHPDFALFAPNTLQTTLWYLSGPTRIGTASGPTLPAGWELITTADFNGDNHPDFVIFKRSTRQAAVVFLNNNVVVGAALLPTFPNGWNLGAVADFNSDGDVDIVLFNSNTRQTVIGYLSGGTLIGAALGPTLPMNWLLVGAADFNGDGHPDYLLYRPDTRQTAIWYLNNNVYIGGAFGVTLPSGWTLLSH
jgi:outer membrane protein assembly factor BamB